MNISVVMITRNAEDVLPAALESVRDIASEILISDEGSDDGTRKIAEAFGATVIVDPDQNLGRRKQSMVLKAKGPWVLLLDSDERLSEELKLEIIRTVEKERGRKVYRAPYRNYAFGKRLKERGEQYSRIILFRKGTVRISEDPVHEHPVTEADVGDLTAHVDHYSYRSVGEVFSSFADYAGKMAECKHKLGERSTVRKIVLYPLHMFWARFIQDGGYRDGWRGLFLAAAFAWMELQLYIKLRKYV